MSYQSQNLSTTLKPIFCSLLGHVICAKTTSSSLQSSLKELWCGGAVRAYLETKWHYYGSHTKATELFTQPNASKRHSPVLEVIGGNFLVTA